MSALLLAAAQVSICMGNVYYPAGSERLSHITYDIAADGKIAGHINSHQVLILDVPDGMHRITRYQHTIWGPKFPVSADITLASDDHRYLTIDMYQRRNPNVGVGIAFGAVGGLIEGLAQGSNRPLDRPPGEYLDERLDGAQQCAGLEVVRVSSKE